MFSLLSGMGMEVVNFLVSNHVFKKNFEKYIASQLEALVKDLKKMVSAQGEINLNQEETSLMVTPFVKNSITILKPISPTFAGLTQIITQTIAIIQSAEQEKESMTKN